MYHKNKNKPHRLQFSTYTFLLRTNSQIVAHFQEMGYKVLVKKDVDRDLAVVIGILKVTEDLDVCEGIHHKGNHLQGKSQHLLELFILHKATASPIFSCCCHQGLMHISCPAAQAPAGSKRFLYSHNIPVNSLCPSMQSIGLNMFFLISTAFVHFHILLSFTISCNVAKLGEQNWGSRQTISTPVLPVLQAATGELA